MNLLINLCMREAETIGISLCAVDARCKTILITEIHSHILSMIKQVTDFENNNGLMAVPGFD